MRKIISIICFAVIIAAMLCSQFATVFAADSYITLKGFTFDINSSNEAVIHGYDDRSADVVIPEKLLGADVVAIDNYTFFNDTAITSVSFSNATHLKTIGVNAFYGCKGLKSLSIPASIDSIPYGAFQNCTGLESVTIENGVTSISDQAFGGCTSLGYIEIPDSVTSISGSAFKNCTNALIYCNEGSYAQTYASQQSIDNILIREFKLGDANLDGIVNIRDVTYIQLFRVGKISRIPAFRGECFADVTGDGRVNIRDATMIQLSLVGLA